MDKRNAGRGLWIKGMQEGDCGEKENVGKTIRGGDKRDAGRGLWIKGMQEGDCG